MGGCWWLNDENSDKNKRMMMKPIYQSSIEESKQLGVNRFICTCTMKYEISWGFEKRRLI